MKKNLVILLTALILTSINIFAADEPSMVAKLKAIDPDVMKFFPRWKVCEANLQIKIYLAFSLRGFDKSKLDQQKIEVLGIPLGKDDKSYEILMITCGEVSISSSDLERYIGKNLIEIIAGVRSFEGGRATRPKRGEMLARDYCYEDIPAEMPVRASEAEAIINYLNPQTSVNQAMTLSLFEQYLLLGETGANIKSVIGTDMIGYPFWYSGESRAILSLPLYENKTLETRRKIPQLLTTRIGYTWRMSNTVGSSENSTISNLVPDRKLNALYGGKLFAGFDFHLPNMPELGISCNMDIPVREIDPTKGVDFESYSTYNYPDAVAGDPSSNKIQWNIESGKYGDENYKIYGVAPILKSSAQVSVFYNLWLNPKNPENFFRFDIGACFNEVEETVVYRDEYKMETFITNKEVDGLTNFKSDDFANLFYFKVEYRNQAAYPFGVSLQYSNEILLGRVYYPIFNWLYLEAKYARPLRDPRPYELEHYFMISPVLRITI